MSDELDKLRASLSRLPRMKWTASTRNVQVPESEDLASCYVECHSNKIVGRMVARYIADANPAVIGALLDAHDGWRTLAESLLALQETDKRIKEIDEKYGLSSGTPGKGENNG